MNNIIKNCLDKEILIDVNDQDIFDYFDNKNNFANEVIHEINTLPIYKSLKLSPNATILDIGANAGFFSLFAYNSNKIIAVEPSTKTFNILKKITKPYQNIIPLQAAISNVDGPVNLYLDEHNATMNSLVNKVHRIETAYQPGGSLYFEQPIHESIIVPGITIGTLLRQHKIDNVEFAKVDIEGGEIIMHSDDFWEPIHDKIDSWLIETHHAPNNMHRDDNLKIILEQLKKYGYKSEIITDDSVYATK